MPNDSHLHGVTPEPDVLSMKLSVVAVRYSGLHVGDARLLLPGGRALLGSRAVRAHILVGEQILLLLWFAL